MFRTSIAVSLSLWAGTAAAELPLLEAIHAAYSAHEAGPTAESYAQLEALYPRLSGKRRGIVGQMLERDSEALVALRTFLDGCNQKSDTARRSCGAKRIAEAESIIDEIIDNSAVVEVTLPGSKSLSVDDTRKASPNVHNEYGPSAGESITLRVRAGEHTFLIRSKNGAECRWQTTVSGGASANHACAPVPYEAPLLPHATRKKDAPFEALPLPHATRREVASYEMPLRRPVKDSPNTWLYPALISGGSIAAVAAVGMQVQARSLSHDARNTFQQTCERPDVVPGPECAAGISGGEGDWKTGALIAAGVSATAGLTLAVVYLWPRDEAPVTAWVSPTGMGVSGTF